jgi:glycosyltransferase involved in cell wall biosynthesis
MPLVGIDAQALHGRQSGLGVFTRNLVAALKEEVREQMSLRIYSNETPSDRNVSTLQRLRWENWTLPSLARHDRLDLLHVPAFAPPICKPCRLVVTVHDLAGMLFKNQMGMLSAFYWGKWLPFAVKKADRIIADSESTLRDLVQHLDIHEKKIRVIYPSGHEAFTSSIPVESVREVRVRLGVKGRFFLFVGTMEPRKNLGRILDAFKRFQRDFPDFQLVLAGSQAFAHGKYAQLLSEKHSLRVGSVVAPGFLKREELNALYCGAEALVFPSLYEGFGIPILEAMASGCPVITSDCTSTQEVVGAAGILVYPYETENILNAIKKIVSDANLRHELRQKGFEQIKKFSWKKTARHNSRSL